MPVDEPVMTPPVPSESDLVIQDNGPNYGELARSIFARPVKGKYKIELLCEPKRTGWGEPFGGVIKVWLSGAAMSGNADVTIYFCPRCHSVIDAEQLGMYDRKNNGWPTKPYYGGLCLNCNLITPGPKLIDFRFVRTSLTNWVELIARYYRILMFDVDLYLKHFKSYLTKVMEERLEHPRACAGIDGMVKNFIDKELAIYSLSRLTRDTANGCSLETALKAFLTA